MTFAPVIADKLAPSPDTYVNTPPVPATVLVNVILLAPMLPLPDVVFASI